MNIDIPSTDESSITNKCGIGFDATSVS